MRVKIYCDEQGGMMPHLERGVEPLLGGSDGRKFFARILKEWEAIK